MEDSGRGAEREGDLESGGLAVQADCFCEDLKIKSICGACGGWNWTVGRTELPHESARWVT